MKITKVEQYPQQLMAIVIHEGKEILIPLAEAYIEKIDIEKEQIIMTLPEGML